MEAALVTKPVPAHGLKIHQDHWLLFFTAHRSKRHTIAIRRWK
jgi:hypothetical protein